MPVFLSPAQKLWLELIKLASFNDFDGEMVVEDLLNNMKLWDSVIMVSSHPGVSLRDLQKEGYNVDTLMIVTDEERLDTLLAVARDWNFDEIEVLRGSHADEYLGWYPSGKVVVKLWWD